MPHRGIRFAFQIAKCLQFLENRPKNFDIFGIFAKFLDLHKGHNTIKDAQAGFQTVFAISLVEIIIFGNRFKFKSKVPEGMISIDVSG